jgi:phosphate transport system ATP-binding protein
MMSSAPPLARPPEPPPSPAPPSPVSTEPEAPASLPAIDESFAQSDILVSSRGVSVYYGKHEAIKSVSFKMAKNNIVAMIGPSGCGKSTFLRSINRLNDLIPGCSVKGELFIDGQNVYDAAVDLVGLRRRVGLVFQKPNPFPKSIYDNIAYGPRLQGIRGRRELDALVEDCLRRSALWEEVKDRLHSSALGLSGGQQQRLCIGRALATKPTVLLMDEPCSALDPIATTKIEDLISDLKTALTIVIVTHNMQQAARVSDYTAFFYMGDLVEYNKTAMLFTNPSQKKTEDYITGRFG